MKILATTILAAIVTAPIAAADVHFRVKSCSEYPVHFWTYNGDDWLMLSPYKHGDFKRMDEDAKDARVRKTACHFGEKCKIKLRPDEFDKQLDKVVSVEAEHYLRLARTESRLIEYNDDDNKKVYESAPIITYTISPHEESCSDPIENAKVLNYP